MGRAPALGTHPRRGQPAQAGARRGGGGRTLPRNVDTFTIVDISAGADRLQVQLQQGAPVVQGGAQQLPGEQLQHGRGGHTGVYQQDGGQEKLIVWLLNRHKSVSRILHHSHT